MEGQGSGGPRATWPMASQPNKWPPSPPRPTPHPTLQHGFSAGLFPPQRSAKPSEKPRLRQIPSAEDLETDGGGVGPPGDDSLACRGSSSGQHEARGPVLQQHQQVWQCPSAPQRCSRLTRGPGIDGREGDRLSVRGTALRPVVVRQIRTHTGAHGAYMHAGTLALTHALQQRARLWVKRVPCPAVGLALDGAIHLPLPVLLPGRDQLYLVQEGAQGRKWAEPGSSALTRRTHL